MFLNSISYFFKVHTKAATMASFRLQNVLPEACKTPTGRELKKFSIILTTV
jgi:hypothetical protein